MRIQQLLSIDVEGFIDIDLAGMPEGFLNPYGGQYSIEFVSTATLQPIEFTAEDGNKYSTICLTFAQTVSNQESNVLVLNVFTSNLPS